MKLGDGTMWVNGVRAGTVSDVEITPTQTLGPVEIPASITVPMRIEEIRPACLRRIIEIVLLAAHRALVSKVSRRNKRPRHRR